MSGPLGANSPSQAVPERVEQLRRSGRRRTPARALQQPTEPQQVVSKKPRSPPVKKQVKTQKLNCRRKLSTGGDARAQIERIRSAKSHPSNLPQRFSPVLSIDGWSGTTDSASDGTITDEELDADLIAFRFEVIGRIARDSRVKKLSSLEQSAVAGLCLLPFS